MFAKVLVANRGEIAVRAFRACYELGIRTVAVYAWEDRGSIHRQKADEAYVIGERGHPVRAYLSVDEIIRVAKESGADAIYPGYGFLSENAGLARAAAEAGIVFVGPGPDALEMAGDKVLAKERAIAAGVPVLRSSAATADLAELIAAADEIGFPVFAKAVAGGGGRGMRRVERREDLPAALESAMREAEAAFGNPAMFIEQAVLRPRHIEVQVLADGEGNRIHLAERDCSVQRRHQKVVEIAPALGLDQEVREALHRDALAFADSIGYVNAGTVEFLLDTAGERAGEHVFIEMNPRIQVEHTVTEEVTDVDLVVAQLRIAAGETLEEMGLRQSNVQPRGVAIQCRITTEDPAQDFRPDTGRITTYRSPGGAGIRLDGGTVAAGVQVSPHFDSMLVKLVAKGRTWDSAVRRARRALAEFRLRGVATNIPFLQAVLDDPAFLAGDLSTQFIEERPYLLGARQSQDRASRLLQWLAEVTVNQPHGPGTGLVSPAEKLPSLPGTPAPAGSRQLLRELGPAGFAAALRAQQALAVTETTFRDAHQSLLATRVRTADLLAPLPAVSVLTPQLLSIEAWGGATYDVALRFLGEDPWERLAAIRERLPNIAIQALLRGRNTVGYTPYPTRVTEAFVEEAAATGVDVFRIFDALNDVSQMRPAIEAVLATGTAVAEGAMSYTGDLLDPAEDLYTLDYWLRLAEAIVGTGAHILGIKDMAGLLRPEAAARLVAALRERFDLPVHVHTHDTAGGQLATLLAASAAGADAVDAASAPMAGTTSQPSLSALVAALAHTERDTGISLRAVSDLEPYWEAVRSVYRPFESGLPGPTGRVYQHEIPGGQLSNLRQQAIAVGQGKHFERVEDAYAAANRILGRPPKVTPSSKAVGDLALALVAAGVEDFADFEANPGEYDIPDSVLGFLAGELGDPPGGWPEPFRTKALAGRERSIAVTPLTPEDEAQLASPGAERQGALNRLLFPGPTRTFTEWRNAYGDLSVIATVDYLYGLKPGVEHVVPMLPGVSLFVGLEAIGEADDHGMRTVMTTLNGHLRPVEVRDQSVEVVVKQAEKADASIPGQVPAPFSGVVALKVEAGQTVVQGQQLAVIEAMKMEAAITAPVGGVVRRVAVGPTTRVEAGDLLVEIA